MLAWLNLDRKVYEAIPVTRQVEILALTGDVAILSGHPSVPMHTILGRSDGFTVGGHVFALHADPTV
jgi:predicted DNA-binding protein with PD1-like motif